MKQNGVIHELDTELVPLSIPVLLKSTGSLTVDLDVSDARLGWVKLQKQGDKQLKPIWYCQGPCAVRSPATTGHVKNS